MSFVFRRIAGRALLAGAASLAAVSTAARAQDTALPRPDRAFSGKVAVDLKDARPAWPQPERAPAGAPNVVIILLDDIGFADTSTFGGVAQTPELDKLAAHGLKYTNFNTTAMCSPTRAALLTGRNHHRVGFGGIADFAAGYPGYDSVLKKNVATIAEVLKGNGYNTAAIGKWHNTPDWEISQTGPFDRWPTGLGFEHFYGFMGPAGMENQWEPTRLYRETTPVDPGKTPEQGYHLTADLVDDAIRWIHTQRSQNPDKPYFLYFAPGAVHSPHQAPRAWIDPYKGKFDEGWDALREEIFARQLKLGVIPSDTKLTPRPEGLPEWASLSADRKRLLARQMEVYAGFVAYTDHEMGRLVDAIRALPNGDDTLILYIVGDNGAAGATVDGGASGATTLEEQLRQIDDLGSPAVPLNYYASGWAWAGNTPFKWWKTFASHFGGTRDPMIISWPRRLKPSGDIRAQFTHVTDIAPTLYELVGITPPAYLNGIRQVPMDGVSFAQTLTSATAPSRHHVQYFELLGNRAIYKDGWVAAARHRSASGWFSGGTDFKADSWELYDVSKDFSEYSDLAKAYPGKLKRLQALFDAEARRNQVYPLGAVLGSGKPSLTDGRTSFTYYRSTIRTPGAALPDFARSFSLTAEVQIGASGVEGVIAQYGDRSEGFVFYAKDDHLVFESRVGPLHAVLKSAAPIRSDKHIVEMAFEKSGLIPGRVGSAIGRAQLKIDGAVVAEGDIPMTSSVWDAALFVGRGAGSPVSQAFVQPFAFTGRLDAVTIALK